jgi:hypothetical protein
MQVFLNKLTASKYKIGKLKSQTTGVIKILFNEKVSSLHASF